MSGGGPPYLMLSLAGTEQADRLGGHRDRREDAQPAHQPHVLDGTVLLEERTAREEEIRERERGRERREI